MMFLGDYELLDISSILNIDMDTVRFYVFGENGTGSNEHCWHQIKKKLGPTAISTFVIDKISTLDKTAGMALNIINENLKRIQQTMIDDTDFTLSIDDTKKLAGILVDMDKIVRLESGKATDIIDNIAHMSVADARRLLAEDPFAPEVIEGEFEDITIPSDNEIESSRDLKQVSKPWK